MISEVNELCSLVLKDDEAPLFYVGLDASMTPIARPMDNRQKKARMILKVL